MGIDELLYQSDRSARPRIPTQKPLNPIDTQMLLKQRARDLAAAEAATAQPPKPAAAPTQTVQPTPKQGRLATGAKALLKGNLIAAPAIGAAASAVQSARGVNRNQQDLESITGVSPNNSAAGNAVRAGAAGGLDALQTIGDIASFGLADNLGALIGKFQSAGEFKNDAPVTKRGVTAPSGQASGPLTIGAPIMGASGEKFFTDGKRNQLSPGSVSVLPARSSAESQGDLAALKSINATRAEAADLRDGISRPLGNKASMSPAQRAAVNAYEMADLDIGSGTAYGSLGYGPSNRGSQLRAGNRRMAASQQLIENLSAADKQAVEGNALEQQTIAQGLKNSQDMRQSAIMDQLGGTTDPQKRRALVDQALLGAGKDPDTGRFAIVDTPSPDGIGTLKTAIDTRTGRLLTAAGNQGGAKPADVTQEQMDDAPDGSQFTQADGTKLKKVNGQWVKAS